MGPAVRGTVVDEASGRPLPDALVVVRFDGRYDDVLPDRDLIGYQEARTDASGRFQMDRIVRPGVSAWPLLKTEARVVGVLLEGYRCAAPRRVPEDGEARIALTPALDLLDRRESCRPVTAGRGEAPAYMEAWRALFADSGDRPQDESERQLDRLLAARTVLGFGENCTGPVTDLALAPGGGRAALRLSDAGGGRVEQIDLASGARRRVEVPAQASPAARLAWADGGALVLVEPREAAESASARTFAASRILPLAAPAADAPPAAPAPDAQSGPRGLDPADLDDESDAFWNGRTFTLARRLDPATGLAADELRVTREDGSRSAIVLPGEACGSGRFGRPHFRMASDGRRGLDLRFVEGGCHAVAIDLETGDWRKLDASRTPAHCETARRIPAANLAVALRGYMREVESALVDGGADPLAAFVLEIDGSGETIAQARDFAGGRRNLRVPRFPIDTPLRRIDVSTIGLARPAPAGAPAPAAPPVQPEPL
jgi:hypothetical protein